MEPTGSDKTATGPRLLFIDNIRIFLMCLVIATHSAVTYGAVGHWFFTDAGNDTIAPVTLTLLASLNQSFFMGFFLFISAYFITGSLKRKGEQRFVHDRLVRLGIPVLVWIVFINPVFQYLIRVLVYNFNGTLLESYADTFIPFIGFGLGPMWFAFFLLVATLAYIAWFHYHGSGSHADPATRIVPTFTSIFALGLILGIITFIVRIFLPMGSNWILFDFQFPFFPQYIAFFILGILAAQNNWLSDIHGIVGKKCAVAALFLVIVQPLLLIMVTATPEGLNQVMGSLHWQAARYAFWEQLAGLMIMTGLLWLFSHRFDRQGPIRKAMAADTYTAYIIHPVILVLFAIALQGLMIPTLGKFVVLLVLTICLVYTIAHIIRALPGVKRVL